MRKLLLRNVAPLASSALLLGFMAGGCGSDDSEPAAQNGACTPGGTQACVGPQQCAGFQTCDASGKGWRSCECGGSGGGGNMGGASGNGGASGSGNAGGTGNTAGVGNTGGSGGTSDGGPTGGTGGSVLDAGPDVDPGLNPGDDPCPTEPMIFNGSQSCGGPSPEYTGVCIQNVPMEWKQQVTVVRTPSKPALGSEGYCTFGTTAPAAYAYASWVKFPPFPQPSGFLRIRVGKPWKVMVGDGSTAPPLENGCGKATQSLNWVRVITDDPNAPARNIYLEPNLNCSASDFWQ